MKGKDEVIAEFNEYVNMTADELEAWLKSDDSNSAGWPKDDAEGGEGESVGHDSGRKIVEILKENPEKKPENYRDELVDHMRKVVAYCKRHLAQEAGANDEKSEEEVKKTKSYASLKNWGHDFLKAKGGQNGSKADTKKDDEKEKETEKAEGEGDEAKAGEKRKQTEEQNGASKKRETRQGEGTSTKEEEKNGGKEEEEEEQVSEEDPDEEDDSSKAKDAPKKGDTVSWNWGNGQPEGKVLDVKGEKTSVTTKRGNEVTRDGKPEDPAVVIDTGKSKAIKSNHELN